MGNDSPSLVVRAIWFAVAGWWLTGIMLTAAWFLNVTVIGLPFGIKLINKVPKALTLKEADDGDSNRMEIGKSSGNSPSLAVRGVYFVLVGWWASAIWTGIAYLLCVSVVGLPFGVKMFNKLPKVVSLYDP